MKAVFADSFYWVALTSPEDSAHVRTVQYSREWKPARPSVRSQAGNTVAGLLLNPGVLVVPQSRETFLAGLELYRARPDKGYSLTDCISMQTMRRLGLLEVLTNDRHFEQEGFRTLFREA